MKGKLLNRSTREFAMFGKIRNNATSSEVLIRRINSIWQTALGSNVEANQKDLLDRFIMKHGTVKKPLAKCNIKELNTLMEQFEKLNRNANKSDFYRVKNEFLGENWHPVNQLAQDTPFNTL
jgi:hypothetical protein